MGILLKFGNKFICAFRRLLCDHPDNDDSDHPVGSSHHEDVSDCETSSSNSKDADQVKSLTLEHYDFFLALSSSILEFFSSRIQFTETVSQ